MSQEIKTKEYKFDKPESKPSFDQLQLLGRSFFAKKLNQSLDIDFKQGQVSDEIDSLNKALGNETKNFIIKNPNNKASFQQFGKLGGLYAESKGLTTMQTVSDAIKGFENASRD